MSLIRSLLAASSRARADEADDRRNQQRLADFLSLGPVDAFAEDVRLDINELASPTPMIEPISVCELEAGRPRYHVPRFQMIAEISSANTMAKPAPDPTLSTSSTGSSARTPNATAPLDVSTPIRFQQPDHTTATFGFERVGVNDGRHRVGGIVKSVDELEAQRQAERQEEKDGAESREGSPKMPHDDVRERVDRREG